MSDFVVVSQLEVADGSQDVLERAFADRLREVEEHDGFLRLEVWRDASTPHKQRAVGLSRYEVVAR